MHRAEALLLDRRAALAVQHPEGHVRARGRLRRRGEADGDRDESEADRAVPGCAHLAFQSNGTEPIRPSRRHSLSIKCVHGGEAHDRAALARRGHGRENDPGVPRPGRRGVEAALVGGGRRAGRELRQRAALARRPQGRRLRDHRVEPRRVGALRLRARLDRGDRRRDLREQLANDVGYILEHSEAIGVLCEDEAQRAKVESVRGAAPRLEHVLTYADLDDLAARGRAHAAEHPNALPRGRGAGRGGRPLHLHLHLRHDRAAEGVHDLAPQLLRDGRRRRRPAELHRPGRRDAPLPSARPQLRPPDAPVGRVRRLRDRIPPTRLPPRSRR